MAGTAGSGGCVGHACAVARFVRLHTISEAYGRDWCGLPNLPIKDILWASRWVFVSLTWNYYSKRRRVFFAPAPVMPDVRGQRRANSSFMRSPIIFGNVLRTLAAAPEPIKAWSLTSSKEKLIKIGAKIK